MIHKCKVRWGQLEILFDMQSIYKIKAKSGTSWCSKKIH